MPTGIPTIKILITKFYLSMKSLKVCSLFLSFIAIRSLICNTLYAQDETGTPSLDDGGGDKIICYCTSEISFKPNGCAANNNGKECHGSINAKCWEYDRNCL